MSFGREYSNDSEPTSFCSVCGAIIKPKTIFCFECGPPELPPKNPEETGISLEQAVFRICGLILFFICIALVKVQYSSNNITLSNDKDFDVESRNNNKKNIDATFEIIHMVIATSANVRNKPSMTGEVITLVEKGMNLKVIEQKNGWSKVQVFEKTGWISSKLIQSEIQENK
jgi:hypothetical protein